MLALNCQEVTMTMILREAHIYIRKTSTSKRTRCETLPSSSRRSTEWLLWKRRDVIAVLLGRLQFPSHLDFPAREPHNPHVLSHWRWDWRSEVAESSPHSNFIQLAKTPTPTNQTTNTPTYQNTNLATYQGPKPIDSLLELGSFSYELSHVEQHFSMIGF